MTTQTIILDFLNFLDNKKPEIENYTNICLDSEKLKIFSDLIDDYDSLVDQSVLAIKSLQIDNYNLAEQITSLQDDSIIMKKKNELLGNNLFIYIYIRKREFYI